MRLGRTGASRLVVALAVLLGLLTITGVAQGATFAVTTTADSNDGGCTAVLCSLRDAVIAANQAATTAGTSTANTINLPPGTYKITRAPSGNPGNEPAAGSFDLVNYNRLTINGAGAGVTVVDANLVDRAFAVPLGAGLTLNGLTVKDGLPYAHPNINSSQSGGGIYSDGPLSLTGVTMSNDNAPSNNGGGIYLDSDAGSFAVANSTFSGDSTGAYDYGGAIYFNPTSGTLGTITNSTFSHDVGYYGSAIYINQGSLTISGTGFDHDNADYGAIYAASGDLSATLTLKSDSFTYDNAYYAGAVYWDDYNSSTPYPLLTIDGSTFTNDSSYYGALYLNATYYGPINITNSSFLNNSSSDYAGAIYFSDGALNINGSTFAGNQAAQYGGALYLSHSAPVSIVNSTISGNSSGFYGGGVYVSNASPLTMLNDTVAFNQAQYAYGGGIYYPSSAGSGSVFQNLIVANNSGGDCGDGSVSDLGTYSTFNYSNSYFYDKGNNLDSDGSCIGNDSGGGAINNQKGVDPLLGLPADNGGGLLTDALLRGSPAIDAGNDGACPATDERGVPRPQGPHCDIGAFEAAAADLALTKSAPATATVGNILTYTLKVTNNGPGPATGVTVTDPLPGPTTYYVSLPSQGTCSGTSTVVCSLGTLASGASATVTIGVVANSAGTVINTASASANEPDPTASDNSASAATIVSAPATTTTTVVPPHGAKPVVVTGVASQITRSSAVVSGTVVPEGLPTTDLFLIGTDPTLGSASRVQSAGTGTTPVGVNATFTRLKAGKRYFFRLVATNADGTSFGAVHRFKTRSPATRQRRHKHHAKHSPRGLRRR